MTKEAEPAGRRSFADKLNTLFRTVTAPTGKPYSNHQVADAINAAAAENGGPTVDHSYLAKLRGGGRAKPSFEIVAALAGFFGVPIGYFSDEAVADRTDVQLALVAAMRDASVRDVALRASGLSPRGLDTVVALLRQVRELEGLPAEPIRDEGEPTPDN